MKIRTGFVSNSSTSSFIILGFNKADIEFLPTFDSKEIPYDVLVGEFVEEKWDYWPNVTYVLSQVGAGVIIDSNENEIAQISTEDIKRADIYDRLLGLGIKVKPMAPLQIYGHGGYQG